MAVRVLAPGLSCRGLRRVCGARVVAMLSNHLPSSGSLGRQSAISTAPDRNREGGRSLSRCLLFADGFADAARSLGADMLLQARQPIRQPRPLPCPLALFFTSGVGAVRLMLMVQSFVLIPTSYQNMGWLGLRRPRVTRTGIHGHV